MTETLPWYGYLFLTLVGLIVLVVGGILLIAIFDAVRLARLKRPPRFQRVAKRELFKQEDLPAIGKKLEMELVDGVPYETRKAVLKTVGPLGTGDLSDILQRTNGDGTLSLCNIQRVVPRKRSHRDGSAPTNYTEIYEFTCLVFQGNEESTFPVLNLQPNVHSVMGKLFNRRMFGALRYKSDPEFHQQILIGTTEPESVRPFLTTRVREVLKQNADLTTTVTGQSIVVYDAGNAGRGFRTVSDGDTFVYCEIIDPLDWPHFYQAAFSVIEAIRGSCSQMDHRAGSVAPPDEER